MKTVPRRVRHKLDERRKPSDQQIVLGSWVMRVSLESSKLMTNGLYPSTIFLALSSLLAINKEIFPSFFSRSWVFQIR